MEEWSCQIFELKHQAVKILYFFISINRVIILKVPIFKGTVSVDDLVTYYCLTLARYNFSFMVS